MEKGCYVKISSDLVEAKFLGVYQFSSTIGQSLMVGGHPGGVIAYPVAVVILGESLKEVKLTDVILKNS